MAHVFISYARSSVRQAEAIAEALRSLGLEVWRDDAIPAHRPYAEVIQERLDTAAAVLVLWCEEATASQWVRSEADRGRGAAKLVQARLDGARLPMPFDQIQCADLRGWKPGVDTPAWNRVVDSITKLTGAEAPISPRPDAIGRSRFWRWGPIALIAAGVSALAGWLAVTHLLDTNAKPPSMMSIAVLPVRNLTGDPALDPSADALTEDVITLLNMGEFTSANSGQTADLRRGPLDPKAVGRRLNVRYLVDASLRRGEPGYRLDYRTIDTLTGKTSDEGDAGAPLANGDFPGPRLAVAASFAIGNRVLDRWMAAETAVPPDDHNPENLTARLNALAIAGGAEIAKGDRLISTGQAAIPETNTWRVPFAGEICELRTFQLDNGLERSLAERARWAQQALDAADEIARLKPGDASPLRCRALIFSMIGRLDDAEAAAQQAVAQTPLAASAYSELGYVELLRGRFTDAMEALRAFDQRSPAPSELGQAKLFMGDTQDAVNDLRQAVVMDSSNASAAFYLTAALQAAGRHADAVAEAATYRKLNPNRSEWLFLRRSQAPAFVAVAERVRALLRAAGLDEPRSPTGSTSPAQ